MRDVLAGAGVSAASIVTIEPGLDWVGEPSTASDGADTDGSGPLSAGRGTRIGESLDALMIANLLPGKGIAPFLRALDAALDEADSLPSSRKRAAVLRLAIVGSAELDVGYASECRDVLAASPRARRAVRFEGTLPRRVLVERLSTADVLVSASRMESFGMALAEARALGVPILAREGGNATSLVAPRSGGELFADDADLARALVRLASDRDELLARAARARSHRIRRSWFDAAAEFAAAFEPKRL